MCRVDGRCISQFISGDPFSNNYSSLYTTDNVRPRSRSPRRSAKRARENSTSPPRPAAPCVGACRAAATLVVHKLLFSAEREALCTGGAAAASAEACRVHHKKKRALHVLDAASCSATVKTVIEEVAEVVSRLEKPLAKNSCLVLGALYLMQHGKAFGNFVIKQSAFLHTHLPSITDLPRFGYERSAVRVGKNIIISHARTTIKHV